MCKIITPSKIIKTNKTTKTTITKTTTTTQIKKTTTTTKSTSSSTSTSTSTSRRRSKSTNTTETTTQIIIKINIIITSSTTSSLCSISSSNSNSSTTISTKSSNNSSNNSRLISIIVVAIVSLFYTISSIGSSKNINSIMDKNRVNKVINSITNCFRSKKRLNSLNCITKKINSGIISTIINLKRSITNQTKITVDGCRICFNKRSDIISKSVQNISIVTHLSSSGSGRLSTPNQALNKIIDINNIIDNNPICHLGLNINKLSIIQHILQILNSISSPNKTVNICKFGTKTTN